MENRDRPNWDAVLAFHNGLVYRCHPGRQQALEEEVLVITEIVTAPPGLTPEELSDLMSSDVPPFRIGGIPCRADTKVPPDEIWLELDGKLVGRVTGLPLIGGFGG